MYFNTIIIKIHTFFGDKTSNPVCISQLLHGLNWTNCPSIDNNQIPTVLEIKLQITGSH